jgi:hypothetical protein
MLSPWGSIEGPAAPAGAPVELAGIIDAAQGEVQLNRETGPFKQ